MTQTPPNPPQYGTPTPPQYGTPAAPPQYGAPTPPQYGSPVAPSYPTPATPPQYGTPVAPAFARPAPIMGDPTSTGASGPVAEQGTPGQKEFERLLAGLVHNKGSDMHLTVGERPRYRVAGALVPVAGEQPSTEEYLVNLLTEAIDAEGWKEFTETNELDTAYEMDEARGQAVTSRFRVNIFRSMDRTGVVARVIPTKIQTLDELGVLPQVKELADKPRGLILVCGPTGSGKALRLDTPIPTPTGTTTMGELREGDWVLAGDGSPCRVVGLSPVNHTPDLFKVTFSDGQSVIADIEHQWLVSSHYGRSAPHSKKRTRALARHDNALFDADALEQLAVSYMHRPGAQPNLTPPELHALLVSEELAGEFPSPESVRQALRMTDCPGHVRAGAGRTLEFPSDLALKCVAARLRERFHHRPSETADLSRMTTGEMLATGLRLPSGHTNFAVPLAQPLHLFHQDLPVDPYVLGVWLGDGATVGARIAVGAVDLEEMRSQLEDAWDGPVVVSEAASGQHGLTLARPDKTRCLRGHAGRTRQYPSRDGHTLTRCVECERVGGSGDAVWNLSLAERLAAAGYAGEKRIPMIYLRSSREQRLALLQGLMDTDGTISSDGGCELSLSDRELAADALDLVRSLGIKASVSWDQPASYRDTTSGEVISCKDRHRIHFTTHQSVFRLSRKAARLPQESATRSTAPWLYITDVTPVSPSDPAYGPARCISVDSIDHTYLAGDGYVVTSNSTTMAGLIDLINSTREERIFTFEDPIEFTHTSKKCLVSHREVGRDTASFVEGLKRVRREDPDIILIGEMRDYETIDAAIEAADTGHLVLGTLHTNSAPETISRIINAFPAERQNQVRTTLSSVLLAVICQVLVPAPKTPRGRVVATEIMMVTPAIRNNIRMNDIAAISNALTDTTAGSISLDAHLAELIRQGLITEKEALRKASSYNALMRQLGKDTDARKSL